MELLPGVFDDLMALVCVVEAGGFSAASKRFDIPVSRLSRRVASLERQLGVGLLSRNTRKFEVTEIGLRIYEQGLAIRAQAQNAVSIARESVDEPTGQLRVQCPMALGASLVGSLAIEFVRKHPRVSLSLITTDGRSSAFSDPVDLLIQPTTKALSDSSLVARKLVDSHYQLVASTTLLATLPTLSGPDELASCPVIGWTFATPSSRWRLEHPTRESAELTVQPRFTTDNLMLVKEAALAGLGIAQLPEVLCDTEVRSGRLQVVLPDWRPPSIAIHALFPSRRVLTPAGRTFLEMLGKAFLVLGRKAA